MQLRRGFDIAKSERVLVCEDVVTTGGSVHEVIKIVKEKAGLVAGVGYIVDRSGGTVKFETEAGGSQFATLYMEVVAYKQDVCPMCKQGIPVTKPGSRSNAAA